jgi:hypothetical protein
MGTCNNNQILIHDPARYSLASRVDVYPGETERLDIVGKFDNDSECYGWSNESYFSNPAWRNPNRQLQSGRYLVHVIIVSSGERHTGVFRLINDVPRQDFRLEHALLGDEIHE